MAEKKSIMTKFMNYCMICGKPVEEVHHALYGNKHKLADEDKLLMPLCRYHHNSSNMCVHQNMEMKALSQMLAQACWEKQWLAENAYKDKGVEGNLKAAKDAFFKRYGENYL